MLECWANFARVLRGSNLLTDGFIVLLFFLFLLCLYNLINYLWSSNCHRATLSRCRCILCRSSWNWCLYCHFNGSPSLFAIYNSNLRGRLYICLLYDGFLGHLLLWSALRRPLDALTFNYQIIWFCLAANFALHWLHYLWLLQLLLQLRLFNLRSDNLCTNCLLSILIQCVRLFCILYLLSHSSFDHYLKYKI